MCLISSIWQNFKPIWESLFFSRNFKHYFWLLLTTECSVGETEGLSLRRNKSRRSWMAEIKWSPQKVVQCLAARTWGSHAPEGLWMDGPGPPEHPALPSRMSLRSPKWSLLLLSFLSFLVMWYLSLPPLQCDRTSELDVLLRVWAHLQKDVHFTLQEH